MLQAGFYPVARLCPGVWIKVAVPEGEGFHAAWGDWRTSALGACRRWLSAWTPILTRPGPDSAPASEEMVAEGYSKPLANTVVDTVVHWPGAWT